jgi:hypothetical protein
MAIYKVNHRHVEVLNTGAELRIRIIGIMGDVDAVFECYSLQDVMGQLNSIGRAFATSPEEWQLLVSDHDTDYYKALENGML